MSDKKERKEEKKTGNEKQEKKQVELSGDLKNYAERINERGFVSGATLTGMAYNYITDYTRKFNEKIMMLQEGQAQNKYITEEDCLTQRVLQEKLDVTPPHAHHILEALVKRHDEIVRVELPFGKKQKYGYLNTLEANAYAIELAYRFATASRSLRTMDKLSRERLEIIRG